MGEILRFPRRPGPDPREDEAAMLRDIVSQGKVKLGPGDQERVAERVDDFITSHGKSHGHGSIKALCAEIWPGDDNPARRRAELRKTKGPKTFVKRIEAIAKATGHSEDDMLLAAFRGTRLDSEVDRRRRGAEAELELQQFRGGRSDRPHCLDPELEQFWATLSDTLHALATSVSRVTALDTHLERMVALPGTYDLAEGEMKPSPGRLLGRPLANWNEHWSEVPPIPSIMLFTEPKSDTVERYLRFHGPEDVLPVQVTVMREVRLAIGPVDDVLLPGPLFEFRSVLQLRHAGQILPVRCPWVYLEEEEDLEVEVQGVWRAATLLLGAGTAVGQADGDGRDPSVEGLRLGRFPAKLEAPLQWEHCYIVWRPVTADTCRQLLLRPFEVQLGSFEASPRHSHAEAEAVSTFCPNGTLGEMVEAALFADGPNSLAALLRAEADRMVALLRGWHARQAAAAEAAHRNLRTKWKNWS